MTRETDPTRGLLNDDEKAAMDAIGAALETIHKLGTLRANNAELVAAVHVLQGFVVQHALARLDPAHFSDWFDR